MSPAGWSPVFPGGPVLLETQAEDARPGGGAQHASCTSLAGMVTALTLIGCTWFQAHPSASRGKSGRMGSVDWLGVGMWACCTSEPGAGRRPPPPRAPALPEAVGVLLGERLSMGFFLFTS